MTDLETFLKVVNETFADQFERLYKEIDALKAENAALKASGEAAAIVAPSSSRSSSRRVSRSSSSSGWPSIRVNIRGAT